MAGVRFADLQSRPTEFLDFTSVTLDEFQQLVPPFEAAFQAHMAAWRLDGKPRIARQFAVDKHCPLPTPEDRLLCILASVKTCSLQVVQGRLFGMGQSKANRLSRYIGEIIAHVTFFLRFTEKACRVNARHKKTRKMQWTRAGAHHVLQIRAMIASDEWESKWQNAVLSTLTAAV
jgi:hypothetical protein